MKNAFVTGANRGLGRAFVDHLLDENYFVYAGTRRSTTKEKDGNNLKCVEIDIANDLSINEAFKFVSKNTEKLDLLVNNAGINKDSASQGHIEIVCELSKLSREHLLKMFNVNSISPMIVIQEFLPLLTKEGGFIINISSNRASFHDEYPNLTGNYGYRASKIALNMFTFASLRDLPKNVKTFAVHPGNVKTDMNPGGTDLAYTQAKRIVAITRNWKDEFNGKFLRYDGQYYLL